MTTLIGYTNETSVKKRNHFFLYSFTLLSPNRLDFDSTFADKDLLQPFVHLRQPQRRQLLQLWGFFAYPSLPLEPAMNQTSFARVSNDFLN